MEVEVPEAVDVLDLVAAHFPWHLDRRRVVDAGRRRSAHTTQPLQALAAEETQHGRVRGHGRAQLRDEIVVMQLHAPAGMGTVLHLNRTDHCVAQAALAAGVSPDLRLHSTEAGWFTGKWDLVQRNCGCVI